MRHECLYKNADTNKKKTIEFAARFPQRRLYARNTSFWYISDSTNARGESKQIETNPIESDQIETKPWFGTGVPKRSACPGP